MRIRSCISFSLCTILAFATASMSEIPRDKQNKPAVNGSANADRGNDKKPSNRKGPKLQKMIDINNPQYFARIYEQTGGTENNHERYDILYQTPDTIEGEPIRVVHFNHDAEVDNNSTIFVEFDREWIVSHIDDFIGEITITGDVISKDGKSRAIEIGGYVTTGKDSDTSLVVLGKVNNLYSTLGFAKSVFADIQTINAQTRQAAEASYLDTLKVETSKKRLKFLDGTDYINSLEAYRNSQVYADSVLPKWIGQAAQQLSPYEELISSSFSQIMDANNIVTSTIATVLRSDVNVFHKRSQLLIEKWIPLFLDESSDTRERYSAYNQIFESLYKLSKWRNQLDSAGADEKTQLTVVKENLVKQLKDGIIPVQGIGAKPGDVIVLKIKNGSQNPRELPIRMHVEEFGWVPSLSSSMMFLNRHGANEKTLEEVQSNPLGIVSNTESSETAIDARYQATPGTTLGFVYNNRGRTQHYSGPFTIAARFLKPSFGINMSFPRFGTQISSVTYDNSGSPTKVNLEENPGATVQIAAGLVVGIWNNAVVSTYGRNFSAKSNEVYTGFGFNFVQLGKVIEKQL